MSSPFIPLVFLFRVWITSIAINADNIPSTYLPKALRPFYKGHCTRISVSSFMETGFSHISIRQILVSFNVEGKYPLSSHSLAASYKSLKNTVIFTHWKIILTKTQCLKFSFMFIIMFKNYLVRYSLPNKMS
jgi:hypothetical protein